MSEDPPPAGKVRFRYLKSGLFRTIHADGFVGAITPRRYIHCAFFSERQAIPRRVEHEIIGSSLSEEYVVIDGDYGFTREVEVDVYLDLSVAKTLLSWLQEQVEQLEQIAEAEKRAPPR